MIFAMFLSENALFARRGDAERLGGHAQNRVIFLNAPTLFM